MSLDSLLPIAPAKVRALVLPLGQIRNDQFSGFLERVRSEHVVSLQDITADTRPNRNMFSPLAYPSGSMIYELAMHMPPPSHLALSPFDLYREPLVVIAIADGKELGETTFSERRSLNGAAVSVVERNVRALDQELEALRDDYGRALVHQVLLFDYEDPPGHTIRMPEGIMSIPSVDRSTRTTMKTAMCSISSLLLAEMTTLAKSVEAMTLIESPGQISSSRQVNGASWGLVESGDGISRRNSQHGPAVNPRSNSTTGLADRSHVRMSMPPVPFKSSPMASNSSTPARPSTPIKSNLANPPTTFESLAAGSDSGPPTPEQHPARPDTTDGIRSQTQDRVSVQGFGPGSANERVRNRGKGRVSVVVGSMYLQAGRWKDALDHLSEGASVARSVNDHVWHGKALELIVVTLFLLAWSGTEFALPSVCYPPPEKGVSDPIPRQIGAQSDNQPKHIRNLQLILPDLLERIVGLYSRVSAENLPPLGLSEVIIRFSKILSAIHLCDGVLGKEAFDMMVVGMPPTKSVDIRRLNVIPSRNDISKFLFRAFPSSGSELITTVDRASILSGIAAVLGAIGQHRKKGLVIRELISVLIGGLVEARTRGAADVGIHPAAGLVALQAASGHPSNTGTVALELQDEDIEHGVDAFLGALAKTYGLVCFDPAAPFRPAGKDDSDGTVVDRIRKQAISRSFGIPGLKASVLRACINFSEALPDFNGVLKYSSDLLRTSGSGVAPGPRKEDASAKIGRDEQLRLLTNITKTYSLSRRLGFNHLTAEYWDEFLVRGVSLDPLAANRTPIPHPKSDLPGATTVRASQDVNPFIYNPFLKEPDKSAVEHTLVVGEPTSFRVSLQNPFDIEVEIERITLDTEGAELESIPDSVIIGPYRTLVLKVTGIPKASGSLKVTGAMIQVRGCRERRFPIFGEPWMPENNSRPKAVGIAALSKRLSGAEPISPSLAPQQVGLKVIPEQPLVAVKSSTLPQSCIMILEGERQTFSVTLENLSNSTPVDFMLFSFEDSTQEPLQAALKNKDSTPSEIYEYETILMKKQALKLRKKQGNRHIAPRGTATFDFEVFGKPGLTSASIQIDYAHLGVPPEEVEDQFYTRRVSVQLTVTVNASVELSRYDILPVLDEMPASLWSRLSRQDSTPPLTRDEYCLLSLDLINAWPSNMLVRLEGADGIEFHHDILPGNTSRVVLPIRRLFLEDPHAAVPSLNPSNRRQFVVSASKISPDFERSVREAFWYKENMLDNLKATWKTMSGQERTGSVELRGIRFTNRMVDAIKVDDVGISVSVENSAAAAEGEEEEGQVKKYNTVFVDEFVQVKVAIRNRSPKPIYPLLRLMPSLCHRPPNVALDHSRKFAWNGTLQQVLPLLNGGASTEVVLGVVALCRGQFEVTASVEETMLWQDDETGQGNSRDERQTGGRERSDTQTLLDKALGKKQRRIWHAREACIINVREQE